jgi:hypothetical protein
VQRQKEIHKCLHPPLDKLFEIEKHEYHDVILYGNQYRLTQDWRMILVEFLQLLQYNYPHLRIRKMKEERKIYFKSYDLKYQDIGSNQMKFLGPPLE